MPWDVSVEALNGGRTRRLRFGREGEAVAYAEMVQRWQGDEAVRDLFVGLLRDIPYDAFLWETPPITRRTWDRPFECVFIDSPALARMRPDETAFAEHFGVASPETEIVTFANLGGDAVLVAPAPRVSVGTYTHLADFVRTAPRDQQHALWRAVGAAVDRRVTEDRPLWISTSGLGIGWLHVRLDTYPKYYSHQPYRRAR